MQGESRLINGRTKTVDAFLRALAESGTAGAPKKSAAQELQRNLR